MKIKSLQLKAFGAFTNTRIDFAARPGVIELVSGFNEAGKSTALRAICDLLFGIPHNSPDVFLHEARDLRIGAELAAESGAALTVWRRKGRKDTLLDAAGTALSDATLSPMLGNLERVGFEMMFGLDHERLRQGGRDIVAGQGEAGPIIFQAGAGMVAFHRARKELDEEATLLFRERSQGAAINAALERRREALEAEKKATLSGQLWAVQCQELRTVELKLQEAAARRRALEGRRAILERIRRHLGPLARRAHLVAEIHQLGPVPDLPDKSREERGDAQRSLGEASVRRAIAIENLNRLRQQVDGIRPDDNLLRARHSVARLGEMRGAARQDAEDLARRESEYRQLQIQLTGLIRQAGYPIEIEHAAELVPTLPAVTSIRELVKQIGALRDQAEVAGHDLSDLTQKLERDREALAKFPPLADNAAARASIDEIVRRGPLDDQLRAAQKLRDREGTDLSGSLKRLALWSGTAAQLSELALPVNATVERFIRETDLRARRRLELTEKLAELREQITAYKTQLTTLAKAGAVITESTVEDRRNRRDQGWSLVRRAFVDGRENVSTEAASFNPTIPLPDAYQASVFQADQAADQLRLETARAARFKTLADELERSQRQLLRLESDLKEASDVAAELDTQWRDLWDSFGIVPLPPAEMKEWLQKREEILNQRAALLQKEDAISLLEAAIDECRAHASVALIEIGEAPARDDERLRDLLARAEAKLRNLDRLRLERDKLEQRVADTERLCEHKRGQVEACRQGLEQRQEPWSQALKPLGCAPDAEPAQVEALLGVLEEIRRLFEKFGELGRRIEGIKNRIAKFEHAAGELTARLAPGLSGLEPSEATVRLAEELKSAEHAIQNRTQLEQEIKRLADAINQLDGEVALHGATLERLCRAARCATVEELEQVEACATHRRELVNELADLDRKLVNEGGGYTLEQVIAEADSHTDGELAEDIDRLNNETLELETRSRDLSERKGNLVVELKQYDGADAAAAAAQQAEFASAAAVASAAEFIRIKVASSVLALAVERFRKAHQAPILQTASGLFARLTLNSFAELTIEMDDKDRLVMLAIRPSGERVEVAGLSDGARDQLYLALRLAAIADYLDRHDEPLPIIADDLLIAFDDPRSDAALEILGEFAQRTQVLLFTHHSRIVERAHRILGPERAAVHDLTLGPAAALQPQAA